MNLKIIYGGAFLAVFLLVTGGLMYTNTMFKNIFAFDFSPVHQTDSGVENKTADNLNRKNQDEFGQQSGNQRKDQIIDSLKNITQSAKADTIVQTVVMDSSLIDSLSRLHKLLSEKTNSIVDKQPDVEIKPVVETHTTKPDTNYTTWVKKTAGLFESMDSKKAAKIIQNYSDNVARDIIYLIKKKKAAEILSELSPDFATRITRAQ